MNLIREVEELINRFENGPLGLERYDEIYFLGNHTFDFARHSSSIARRLGNFSGVISRILHPEQRLRVSNLLRVTGFWRFIDVNGVIERNKSARILVVDFNDTLAGLYFGERLKRAGIHVVDFLKCLHDLDLPHTYETVRKERDASLSIRDDWFLFADKLNDVLSKQTILARLKTLVSLDRRYLIEVSQPYGIFTSGTKSGSAICVDDNEVYADIGAAHGDTVTHFFGATRGRFKEIHAFEPDPVNYESLKSLCEVLPRSKAYPMGLGDSNSSLLFREDPTNRFGSRFVAENNLLKGCSAIPCMKLDDILKLITVMKIDVEGFECKVINGSKNIIQDCRPSMYISGYHYPADLLDIYQTVMQIHTYKEVAVRHTGGNLWDTNILFSDRQTFSY